ncbi:MAG: hypothetical protein R2717_03695 [Schumannella sp.]
MIGDVAVVHGVLGLHTRDDPERGETPQIRIADQLRVLDAASLACVRRHPERLEGVERDRGGPVADRVDGGHEPPLEPERATATSADGS